MILIGRFMIVKYENAVTNLYKGNKVCFCAFKGEKLIYGERNLFTPETYKILKENFPTKIDKIIGYANRHSQIVPFINEDPMLVCSLGIEGMPIRWHRMVNGYWDTGLQVTMNNWNKIRYILDAVATTTNVGNRWFANGIGGGYICG